MKKTFKLFQLLCVLFVSVCNVYLSATTKENFVDLMLKDVDSANKNKVRH